jgi:hypothetical protein
MMKTHERVLRRAIDVARELLPYSGDPQRAARLAVDNEKAGDSPAFWAAVDAYGFAGLRARIVEALRREESR